MKNFYIRFRLPIYLLISGLFIFQIVFLAVPLLLFFLNMEFFIQLKKFPNKKKKYGIISYSLLILAFISGILMLISGGSVGAGISGAGSGVNWDGDMFIVTLFATPLLLIATLVFAILTIITKE